MKLIGKFEILDSFKITGRGLVARGNIIDGIVKKGAWVTLNFKSENLHLKITSVEMVDNIPTKEYWVGLFFAYDEDKKDKLINVQLSYQVVDIIDKD